MIDLSLIKSAKIITGAEAVENALQKRVKQLESFESDLSKDENGRTTITRQTGFTMTQGFTMPSAEELKAMATKVGLNLSDELIQRAEAWWASDERVDRHGDIVEQSWKFDNFQNNPVLLYCHEWGMPPVGNIVSWNVANRSDGNYKGDALQMIGVFATKEMYDFADSIFRLVRAKFLRTVSVGFYPGEIIDIENEEERAKLGLGRWGYIYRNNEMIELSPCSVPANAGAYQILNSARKNGILNPRDILAIREMKRIESLKQKRTSDMWRTFDKQLQAAWKQMFPDLKMQEHTNIEETILADEIEETSSVSVPALESQIKTLTETVQQMKTQQAADSQTLSDIRELLELSASTPPSGEKGGTEKGAPTELSSLQALLGGSK